MSVDGAFLSVIEVLPEITMQNSTKGCQKDHKSGLYREMMASVNTEGVCLVWVWLPWVLPNEYT